MKLKIFVLLFLLFSLLVIWATNMGILLPYIQPIDLLSRERIDRFAIYGALAFMATFDPPWTKSYRAFPRFPALAVILVLGAVVALEGVYDQKFSFPGPDTISVAFSLLGILFGIWLASRKKE